MSIDTLTYKKIFSANNTLLLISLFYIFFLFFGLGSCPAQGQEYPLNSYTADKDTLWSRMVFNHSLSNDGKWLSYTINYKHREDTLVLTNTINDKRFLIPSGHWGRFSENNNWFACNTKENMIQLIGLEKDTVKQFKNVLKYHFAQSGNYFILLKNEIQEDKGVSWVEIIHLYTGKRTCIKNVTDYQWHPKKDVIVVTIHKNKGNCVQVFDLDTGLSKTVQSDITNTFHKPMWSANGKTLVFMEKHMDREHANYQLHYTNLKRIHKILSIDKYPDIFQNTQIIDLDVQISRDGEKVSFYRAAKNINENTQNLNPIEIWDTDDKWLHPKMQKYNTFENSNWRTLWYPLKDRVIPVEIEKRPTSAWNINHSYALTFDKLQYQPQYKLYEDVDIYLTNIITGESKKLLEEQYNGTGFITVSPTGKYISYFRNNHWWVYDTKTDTHINLTKNLSVSFKDTEYDQSGDVPPFGNPGWSNNDEEILLYDKFDIWKVRPDGMQHQRLTKGRENKVKFRITQTARKEPALTDYAEFNCYTYHLHEGLLLSGYADNHTMGYYHWYPTGVLEVVIERDKNIDEVLATSNYQKYVYRIQDYHEPPSIYVVDREKKTEKLLIQSNPELMKYDLGRSELITYLSKEGDSLQGVLVYPAHFDPQKKYPMIVNVYEKLSYKLHRFTPPSDYEYTGFNAMRLATSGYFVLFPDITYKQQEPGLSALRCVKAAVEEVLRKEIIDKNKIGLIGHSFGGYETTFIISQTDIFAAAVAGGSITDFSSFYFNVGWNSGEPDMWRFENHQFRMGDSYFNIPDAYNKNSPIQHADKINTPLLLWTGKEDLQVHWYQSIALYLALRRMDKKTTLILYPNEKHNLMQPKNQEHLSKNILNWFNKYLK